MGLPDPDIQPDTDWRWVAHAAWGHAQLALNRISTLEERIEKLEGHDTPDVGLGYFGIAPQEETD